ncbi:MAG TPA: cytochrome c oxidase assembly protein [Pseudomonadales bacterium]
MPANATKTLVLKLMFAVVGMFGFGFALVPLYDVFCEIAGINGKTSSTAYQAVEVAVDESRTITVQFVASNNADMKWEFKPNQAKVVLHPGEAQNVSYFARNTEQRSMTAQAIPSVSPGRAAAYLHKTECFCFNQQTLAGGESLDMPIRFFIDQDLPKDIHTITLSYTIFDVTDSTANTVASAN